MADDTQRKREFYTYYHPFQTLSPSQPVWVDLHDAAAVAAHAPVASPDKALTAFCQLLALKLSARRALLLFFDDRYAYVLAEATQSLSLQRDFAHAPDDGLWLGHAVAPKGFSICEHTVNFPPANKDPNHVTPSASRVHIINDLRSDARFARRPYVTSGPLARFYAGVPITTPRGINIGALCVLDSSPRPGLSDGQVDFLVDMGATVMDHLEALRARAEHKRGMQMIAGLSAFMQGTSNVDSALFSSPSAYPSSTTSTATKTTPATNPAVPLTPVHPPCTPTIVPSDPNTPTTSEPCNVGTITADATSSSLHHDQITSEILGEQENPMKDRAAKQSNGISPPDIERLQSSSSPQLGESSINETFQSAASIVQQALDLDGVLFFDTSVITFGGLVGEQSHVSTKQGSDSGFDSSNSVDITWDAGNLSTTTADGQDLDQGTTVLHAAAYAGSITPVNHQSTTQRTIRTLCRRYPRGKIWCFSDHETTSPLSGANCDSSNATLLSDNTDCGYFNIQSQRGQEERENEDLAKLIPGVQCIALMPVQDSLDGKCRAAAILYTFSPQRTFSPESELYFMAAFSDVLVAQLTRDETRAALQQRNDFMSSLSHELRTPLHGILGTVEQLYEESSPSIAAKMVSQIELCGRTLLDVINHLLDFSEVTRNSSDSDPYAAKSNRTPHSDSDGNAAAIQYGMSSPPTSHAKLVPMDLVTAEAIEACILSHRSSYADERSGVSDVTITLRMTPNHEADWSVYVLEGAWKRICMNLVTNALKYTDTGYASITLKQNPATCAGGRPTAVFCVEDSGRGMSKDYLSNRLFDPFTQENKFSAGSGLGMNIVAQLVRAMDGQVDVQSHLGTGTIVTVTVPLTFSTKTAENDHGIVPVMPADTSALLLGEWSSNLSTSVTRGQFLLRTGIQKTLEELGVTLLQSEETSRATFFAAFEDQFPSILDDTTQYQGPDGLTKPFSLNTGMPLMLICKTYASARQLETRFAQWASRISFVSEPYGPAQLAEAVNACVSRAQHSGLGSEHDQSGVKRPLLRRISSSHQRRHALKTSTHPSAVQKPLKYYFMNGEQHATISQQYDHLSTPETPPLGTPISPGLPSKNTELVEDTALRTRKGGDERLTILLVDDNHINLQLLSTYCKREGHRSFKATDGQQALEQYQQAVLVQTADDVGIKYSIRGTQIRRKNERPQVILLDINMPVMDGLEAARAIREFERTMAIDRALIIAMTGSNSSDARKQAFASGIDLFFSKPVKLKELTEVLREESRKLNIS